MLPRCIVVIDVDSFDLQILQLQSHRNEFQDDEETPKIVADNWGKITSIGYLARKFGIRRDDTIELAQTKCPALKILRFPVMKIDKPDYRLRRLFTHNILQCIKKSFPNTPLELVSSDDMHLDFTHDVHSKVKGGIRPDFESMWPKTTFEGSTTLHSGFHEISSPEDLVLLHGGVIASSLIRKIQADVKVRTSVGVSYNRMVAKLACSLNRPGALTIVSPNGGLSNISSKIPLTSVPGLGGRKGEALVGHFETMSDLRRASVEEIMEAGKKRVNRIQALEYLKTCGGNCEAPVVEKMYFAHLTVAKTFPENSELTKSELTYQLEGLIDEVIVRIEEEKEWNGRIARNLNVSIKLQDLTTHGVSVPGVAFLSPSQILSQIWTGFKYASQELYKIQRIELNVKRFD